MILISISLEGIYSASVKFFNNQKQQINFCWRYQAKALK